MILYSTNPIAWANDDDQSIGAHIPTEQILREAGREIGFDGIENGHRWPEDPQALKALLGAYGLRFISGWYSTELLTRSVADEIAAVQGHLAKLKANGCRVCITCECSNTVHGRPDVAVNDRPRLNTDQMAEFGAKMKEFAAYLASQGITLAYHHTWAPWSRAPMRSTSSWRRPGRPRICSSMPGIAHSVAAIRRRC